MHNNTHSHTDTDRADTVLVVMDGSLRAHTVIAQVLQSGRYAVVMGRSTRDLITYVDAGVADRVWPVVADPADPTQVDSVIERATDMIGPIIMVVDPGDLLSAAGSTRPHAA